MKLKNLNMETIIAVATAAAGLVFFLLPSAVDLEERILITWSAGIVCFLVLLLTVMSNATPERTRARTRRREPDATINFFLVICTTLASLFAIGFMLANGKDKNELTLAIMAIICSWLLTHTTFAIYYARFYYNDDIPPQQGEYAGGLEFPTDELPDYLDFMYFAITISMTSQTSDVSITSRSLRRLVLVHEMVSFFFSSVILGLSIGIIGDLI